MNFEHGGGCSTVTDDCIIGDLKVIYYKVFMFVVLLRFTEVFNASHQIIQSIVRYLIFLFNIWYLDWFRCEG